MPFGPDLAANSETLPDNSSLKFDVLLPTKDFTDTRDIAEEWYYMCFESGCICHRCG